MDITETLSEGLKRKFKVVIPATSVTQSFDKKVVRLSAAAEIPGFRKGKVPPAVIKSRYGESVRAEAIEELLGQAMEKVMKQCGQPPAQEPKVDLANMDADKDLEFSVEMELLPEITVPEFSSIAVNRPSYTPSAAEIDTMLEDLAKSDPALEDVTEDRGAQKGETLIVDFLGKVGDHAFEGGTGKDMRVVVAGPGFIPGFSEQMEGMKLNENRDIVVTFPADYPEAKLAGKEATFDIKVTKIQAPKPASVDDALAERQGFDDLAGLRESCERRMKKRAERLTKARVHRAVLDALAEKITFPAPVGLVDQEFGAIWAQLERDRQAGMLDDEDKGKSDDVLRDEYRAIAERRVRLGLLLRHVAKINDIDVSEEQLRSAALEEAFRVPSQAMQIMEMFRKNPSLLQQLTGPLLEEKVIEFIVEKAQVSDQPVTLAELEAEPEAEAA